MNISFSKKAQSGFTLIELIVVIVILGILAATALPKFADLSGDARAASLQGARGAINSASAMVHGKWLISNDDPVSVEGGAIDVSGFGYPTATSIITAAGLSTQDYRTAAGTGGTSVTIRPANMPAALDATCNVVYTEPTAAGEVPTVTITSSDCG